MELKASVRRKNGQTAMTAIDTQIPQTIQQQRAAFSYQRVRAMVSGNTPDHKAPERFKAYATSFPAKVQMNGLGQALAFARSKSSATAEGRAWQHLYQLVSDWLARPEGCFPNQDVLEGIMSSDMQVYCQAQAEVQALMVWVKQFARAEIRGGD